MAMPSLSPMPRPRRRILLVDFDWGDADMIPRLLHHPGTSVRLVAGAEPQDAGVWIADLCGLPRTLDLADLTREIFDLALVSERSPRRTQVEGLLLALGTPSLTPQSYLVDDGHPGETLPAVEVPLELHAAALESTLGGDSFEAMVEQALPLMTADAPTAPRPVTPRSDPRFVIPSLDDFPNLEDRRGLEGALRVLVSDTGAAGAMLRVEGPDAPETVVEVGPEDALMRALVDLAELCGTPQVVISVLGSPTGTAWGAWPFRTARHRGVLAAGGILPERWSQWETMMQDLRATWDHREREKAAPAFPMVPATQAGWIPAAEFVARLELAVERHRRDGLRFALHRLDFPASAALAVDRFAERLPKHLRETDSICRPTPQRVLLLTATPRERFPYLRGRLATLWQESWLEAGKERPIPGLADQRCEVSRPQDAEAFLAQGRAWLEGATG